MDAPAKSKSNVIGFLCFVLFLDAVGFGLILPVMPDLVGQLARTDNSRAAEIAGYLLFTYAAIQFLCAPILGALSDRYGRKPVLVASLIGFGLDYFIMAIAPSMFFLFVARAVSGVFGATFAAASAAIVDAYPEAERAKYFGLAGAAIGLGYIFGPVIGGLLGEQNARLPFIAAGVFALIGAAYGALAFPETHPPDKRRAFDWRRANPLGSLISVARSRLVVTLLAALFCIQLSQQSYTTTWAFFTKEVAGWTAWPIGISTAFYGLLVVIAQGVLLPIAVKRFGEVRALWIGLASGICGYAVLAFAGGPVSIYAGILFAGFSFFAFPSLQALMTRATPADAQGELQGAVTSSYCLASIIGPLTMNPLFGAWSDTNGAYFPGAPFVFAAVLLASSFAILAAFGVQRLQSRSDTASAE